MPGRTATSWMAPLALLMAAGALALSLMMWWDRPGAAPAQRDAAAPPHGAPLALAGKTGLMSRLAGERRAVMRIQLTFGPAGVLQAVCVAETADGTQAACFAGAATAGTWSLDGASLCLVAPAAGIVERACYALSGTPPQVELAGQGLLAGAMSLR